MVLQLSGSFSNLKQQVEAYGGTLVGGQESYNERLYTIDKNLISRYHFSATTIQFQGVTQTGINEIIFWNFRDVVDFNVNYGDVSNPITKASYSFPLKAFLFAVSDLNYKPYVEYQ